MPTNAETYRARVEAVDAQDRRLAGEHAVNDVWTGALAERFRADPRRDPEPLVQGILEYVRPDDTIVDVGGGAGRLGLPLALRGRELIVVDPSAGMKQVFDSVVAEAGIKNARYEQRDWLDDRGVTGDMTLVSHVTYFVADIVSFIDKLSAASRRRVMIVVGAEPPPNTGADLFQLIYEEPLLLVPGHRELLPVLWDLGILPEVRVYGGMPLALMRPFATRQEAIEASSTMASLVAAHRERATQALEAHFDDLFVATEGGYRRRRQADVRQILITWETNPDRPQE